MKNILRIALGAFAGLVATLPMTLLMDRLHQDLPSKKGKEKEPLPPRILTMKVLQSLAPNSFREMPEDFKLNCTLLAHFGFGSLMGALYGAQKKQKQENPILGGIQLGIQVWLKNYQIGIPALGLLPPASDESNQKKLLMAGSHVVWGIATVGLFRLLSSETNSERDSETDETPLKKYGLTW